MPISHPKWKDDLAHLCTLKWLQRALQDRRTATQQPQEEFNTISLFSVALQGGLLSPWRYRRSCCDTDCHLQTKGHSCLLPVRCHPRPRKHCLGLVFSARCLAELRLCRYSFLIGEKNEHWNILCGPSKPRVTDTSQLNNRTWDIRKPRAENFRGKIHLLLHGTHPPPVEGVSCCPKVSRGLPPRNCVLSTVACPASSTVPTLGGGREGGMRKWGEGGREEMNIIHRS